MSAFRFELTAKMCRMTIIKSYGSKPVSCVRKRIDLETYSAREDGIRRTILAEPQRCKHECFPEGFELLPHTTESKGEVGNQLPDS